MNKNEEFQNKLDKIHNGKIILISDYIDSKTKIRLRCKDDGYEWEVKYPSQLVRTKRPTGCPMCSNNVKGTTESFRKEVKELVGTEYDVIGEYKNNCTPLKMKHNKCNKIYEVRPGDFKYGYRCPYCSHGHLLKTQEEFEDEIKGLTNGEYCVVSNYTGCNRHVLLEHSECGCVFPVLPRNFLSNNTRCPECASKQSKGVKKIESVLNSLGLLYEKEISFDDLKYKKKLRIDYYIKSLNLYIEFDGKQHFSPQAKFGGEPYLIEQRKKDIIKNNYFKENKLNLLRIDDTNYGKFIFIIKNIMNNRSTTISKYNLYYIENGNILYNNGKYTEI